MTSTIQASAHTRIARPVERVFEFVAIEFFRNYQRWSPEVIAVEKLSQGPLTVGTLGRQVRVDYGRRTQSEFRVSALEEHRRIAFRGASDPYRLSYDFEDQGGCTALVFSFELTRIDPHVRPFRRLVRRVVRRSTDRLVESVREVVERELS